jgi:hypothetical protein
MSSTRGMDAGLPLRPLPRPPANPISSVELMFALAYPGPQKHTMRIGFERNLGSETCYASLPAQCNHFS